MSAEAGFNFNDMAIRMGMNQTKSDGSGDGANEKDIFEFLFDAIGSHTFQKATKLTGIANAEGLLNTGITKQFDSQGLQEKMINPMGQSFSSPGGFLYRIFSALIKNSAITDHTQGVDTNMHLGGGGGDYSGGGGDAGGGSSGGGSNYGEASMSDMASVPMGGGGPHIEPMTVSYGGHTYEAANMSIESLGQLTPSAGADLTGIRGKGDIEIG